MQGFKPSLSKVFAKRIRKNILKWSNSPFKSQEKVFQSLLKNGKKTVFGKQHSFDTISSHEDFIKKVPIRDYEELKPYIDRVVAGEENILWPGLPLYFAKTSGTTSGAKYIPLTKKSLKNQIEAARNALLNYIAVSGKSNFTDGKMIFLQGSPTLNHDHKVPSGRLSGIVAHYVPKYLQKNRLPSLETNCIEDWETKVAAVVEETLPQDMRLISGIPSWVQMYFEKLKEESGGQKIMDIFPNFDLFVYGGVNYEPYRQKFEDLIGKRVDSIELFPASEGFFAFQDRPNEKGMLLLVDGGIFYEFVPAGEIFNDNPTRLSLEQVEMNVDYALIISTNAGLWAYNIGDTVRFISKEPYRVVVSGRIKHFTSAFGEHVIAYEVEEALRRTVEKYPAQINEFHVAPEVNPTEGLPYHEWLIEFEEFPQEMDLFKASLDFEMQQLNPYYKDLLDGNILKPIVVHPLKKGHFNLYMDSIGKLGGQNKVPRLADNRKLADAIKAFQ